jgi:acetyl-CoA carboxylase biotin carboxyl carrier protein
MKPLEKLFHEFGSSSYGVFEVQDGNQGILLKKSANAKSSVKAPVGNEPVETMENGSVVKATRVGFFRASIKVGEKIQKGQGIGTISAMNLAHEQKSSMEGVVSKILVEDGDGVAYGDVLLELEG